MTPIQTFTQKAPWLMDRLMADFPLSLHDAAAIAGNGGAESNGFTAFQEIAPTVKNSRGGWGWFQWTGPRRRAFEAYCDRHGYDRKADESQYKFLFLELKGPEAKAIAAVKAAGTLKQKVIAFELAFERAGVKHYDSRVRWAMRALAAYQARGPVASPEPTIVPATPEETTMPGPAAVIAIPALLELLSGLINRHTAAPPPPVVAPVPLPMPTPIALPDAEPKSPVASLTVGSAVVALLGAGFTAYQAFKNGDTEVAMASVTTIMGSLGAIIGRFKATKPISRPK